MFRFREVESNIERRNREEEERRKNERYLTIKPETNITVDECKNYWNDLFGNMSVD